MALASDLKAIPGGERFDGAVHARKKIVAMRLDMEADQVCAEQPIDQIARPGADSEDFRIGPWNVPENGDACIGAGFLDHSRKQREMIILRQDDRRFDTLHFLEQRIGEAPIHLLIGKPVIRPENRTRMRDVAERPESFVGETLVIAFFLFGIKPDAAQRVGRMIGRNTQAVAGVNYVTIGITGSVGNPGSIGGKQNGFQGGYEAARGHDNLNGPVVPVRVLMHVWFAIRDHKEGLVLELYTQADAQALRRPQRNVGFTQPRFFFGRGASSIQVASQMGDLAMNLVEKFALGKSWRITCVPRLARAQSA